jgi:hypothetical protein
MKDSPKYEKSTAELTREIMAAAFTAYACTKYFGKDIAELVEENLPENFQPKKGFLTNLSRQYAPTLFELNRSCPPSFKKAVAVPLALTAMFEHGKHVLHLWHDVKNGAFTLNNQSDRDMNESNCIAPVDNRLVPN